MEKEILVWNSRGDMVDALDGHADGGSIRIGEFAVSEMIEAFEKAKAGGSKAGSVYDIVTNNCASFLVNLAAEMNFKIDARMVAFVTRRLLEESGKDLADRIRNSVYYPLLFGDRHNGNHYLVLSRQKKDKLRYTLLLARSWILSIFWIKMGKHQYFDQSKISQYKTWLNDHWYPKTW